MRLEIDTKHDVEPLDLKTVKDYLGIIDIEQDEKIYSLMNAARLEYEKYTDNILMESTWDLYLDAFAEFYLPYPCTAVNSVKYYDTDEVEQTLSSDYYDTDLVSNPARVTLAYGYSWPSTYSKTNAVTVNFTSGYATAAAVPEDIKHGLLCWVAGSYDDREELMEIGKGFWAYYRVMPL